jgi:hypothetical protein
LFYKVMTTEHEEPHPDDFALVRGGPSHGLAERLGMGQPIPSHRLMKVGLLWLATWMPLLLLSSISGRAIGEHVKVPLLYDPEVHARFLFVLPLLELAEAVVAVTLAVQAKHFLEMGVVSEQDRPRFNSAKAKVLRLRGSAFVEGAILVLSYIMALVLRLAIGVSEGSSSWERLGSAVTVAGWWYMLVSLPILYFFLLRWVWVFCLWTWFLFRISRLDLKLTPTHPDRAGGLGFVGWGLASFATVLMAFSAVFSAGFADQILHRGESLDSLKYHVAIFLAVAIAIVHLPMLVFSAKLLRIRFTGLLEFGALAWRYDQAFDEKWIKSPQAASGESILGSADVQSLADVATCYEHVDRMWPIPFDMKAFAVLVLAALIPMVPLLGTAVPLTDIFMKLGALLI